jgi:DNA processing protein
MALDERLGSWLRLSLVPGLGAEALRGLLAAFGEPARVFEASAAQLARHVPEALAAAIVRTRAEPALAAAEAWLADPGNRIVAFDAPEYPPQLRELADPPAVLYVRGRIELLSRPALAVVGSRNATPQGEADAEAFARALSDAGLTIVSGLALGIDAAAHRGGLAGAASSVAVLGTGADRVYPARNRTLAHELAARGALVTEFPLGTPALAANFPRRNRLLSGLALGCLVVEAAAASGSLITARLAAEQGREVFAVPGSIHSPLSKGCHALIKQGAKLVETAADVLEELRVPAPRAREALADEACFSPRARLVLAALGHDPCDADALAARSGLSAAELGALLTELELAGAIAALPGGRFQRIARS